jgi:heptosyltransferase-2
MTRKTLVIKIGALGDVLRTTPLLRRLSGSVTWVTDRRALPLLAGNRRIARLLTPESGRALRREKFDWIINFDEDIRACALAGSVDAKKKTGALLSSGKLVYCEASAPWFDMSLISRLGRKEADRRKYLGRKTYQHYLFKACGFRFAGEEYMLPVPTPPADGRPLIAIETRSGSRWPLKHWPGFAGLTKLLGKNGIDFFVLRQRKLLRDYISDINRCTFLVSGDTLAMHIALALRKRSAAVFNCTSPWEIHGYGRLRKFTHPRLRDLFYSTRPPGKGLGSIPVSTVFKAVMESLNL